MSSALRGRWVWRIAQRHLVRFPKTRREELATFANIETMIAAGDANPPQLDVGRGELELLGQEMRVDCTGAIVLA